MIFPSLFVGSESGAISQISMGLVVAFSFCLNRWKKIALAFVLALAILIAARSAFAYVYPGTSTTTCGTECINQKLYYGNQWDRSIYAYPSIFPSYWSTNSNLSMMPRSPYAQTSMVYCVQCGGWVPQSNTNYATNPWWLQSSALNYSNYNYPGSWNQTGLNNYHYDGNGQMVMGKPNVYVSGKAGTEIKVTVKLAKGNNLLAAVPIHGKKGWNAKLAEDGQLRIADTIYSHLFYDYRLHDNSLQTTKGFCVQRHELIPRLEAILIDLKFRQSEVDDFTEYWKEKIPPNSDEFCVYPQMKELDSVAQLVVMPPPKKVTRVGLVIIPQPSASLRFSKKPSSPWVAPEISPSNAQDLEIREWGVGFPIHTSSR